MFHGKLINGVLFVEHNGLLIPLARMVEWEQEEKARRVVA